MTWDSKLYQADEQINDSLAQIGHGPSPQWKIYKNLIQSHKMNSLRIRTSEITANNRSKLAYQTRYVVTIIQKHKFPTTQLSTKIVRIEVLFRNINSYIRLDGRIEA